MVPSPPLSFALQANRSAPKIKHIIIIVQENRSFNNLFYGYPGAKTASYGYDKDGKKIALKPVTLATSWDLQHNAKGFLAACNGTGKIPGTHCRMNGFDNETWTCTMKKSATSGGNLEPAAGATPPPCPNPNPPYSYVPHDEVKPYFDMAKQYVLADEMYASDYDSSSFISHQYIITGRNPQSSVDYPDGSWGCSGAPGDVIGILGADRQLPDPGKKNDYEPPCWDPQTLGDELDTAGLDWAFYAVPVAGKGALRPDGGSSRGRGIWSAYQAIKHIYDGPDWSQDVLSPPAKFLNDLGRGSLRSVTWITPTYANSDHGGSASKTGPSWVTSLVNSIGESPYWDSSAIFVFWDDYGGWYDPEKPSYVDNDGLGARLPLLIISPYAKRGHVSHVHYEHGSILKFVEEQFGLHALSASDQRAKSPSPDCFDFSQPPRKFVPIEASHGATYFENEPLDTRTPDSD
ncbi:MAG TPA: alkaline phosphatase family protein [Candidatus Cybelea sp.]